MKGLQLFFTQCLLLIRHAGHKPSGGDVPIHGFRATHHRDVNVRELFIPMVLREGKVSLSLNKYHTMKTYGREYV
jgi:hypothetical protein